MANKKNQTGRQSGQTINLGDSAFSKPMPHEQELEDAVLGACLLEPQALQEVSEIIASSEVFYGEVNKAIFDCMKCMSDEGRMVDLLTVTEELRRRGQLEAVGGAYHLTLLAGSVLSTAHTESHSRIILEKYILRQLIHVSGTALGESYQEGADCFEVMESAEKGLYDVASMAIRKDVSKSSAVAASFMRGIQEKLNSDVDFTGIPTGIPGLDTVSGGWQNSDLVILAARPSVGKTAFTSHLALTCAQDPIYGGPVAIFNLEMGEDQIMERMVSNVSGVPLERIKRPKTMSQFELQSVSEAANRIAQMKIFIDDTAGLTLSELRSKARRLRRKYGVKMIVIDYLQLMASGDSERNGNREQEIAKISRGLKKMAKDLKIPVIALSQMSRGIDASPREPQLSDLRESGAIEQDADIVMFLWRPNEKTLAASPELRDKVLLSIKKHRNGALEDIVMNFEKDNQRFSEHRERVFNDFQPSRMPAESLNRASKKQSDLPF